MPLLAGIGPIGPFELALILLIVVLIFGAGKLADVGGAVGKSVREFRKAAKDDTEPAATTTMHSTSDSAPTSAAAPETIFCAECGTKNLRSAKFCAQCGHAIATPVT